MTISEIDAFLMRNGIISPPTPEEAAEEAAKEAVCNIMRWHENYLSNKEVKDE